jgi:hypothetical protein
MPGRVRSALLEQEREAVERAEADSSHQILLRARRSLEAGDLPTAETLFAQVPSDRLQVADVARLARARAAQARQPVKEQ